MNQIRLITDSRDEWTVKELVETLHAKVDDLERKLDAQLKRNEAISWQLHAIILHLTGDRAALTAFVMASEPTVVPNEDEAMPVVATCPPCAKTATADTVVALFGYRPTEKRPLRVQSWCRECRDLEQATSPRKNVRLRMPDDVRAMGKQATVLGKEGQALIQQAMDIATTNSGRMSHEGKRLLDAGTAKVNESKALRTKYGSIQKALKKAAKAAK